MRTTVYRGYLLAVLAIIFAFNNVDRLALGIVLQDIKLDLHLSDTQLGLLTGIAFAFFYSLMGIPIARWADRGNRITIISSTTSLWSAALALCAMAATFLQLLLFRVCAAVGEAGCLPSALSLIADYFPRAERPRAVALYLQGGSLSLLLGYFLAGWLNQFYGWRSTFLWIGLPGLALAVLAFVTLREPRLGRMGVRPSGTTAAAGDDSPMASTPPSLRPARFIDVCATLWTNSTFRQILFFYSIMCFFNLGLVQWQPAFLIRSFGLRTGELGTWSAAVCGFGMMAGLYLGGEWASRRAARNERLQLRAMAIMWCLVGAASCAIYLSPNKYWAFGFMALWNIAGTTSSGPLNAMIQSLVPERMRATAMTVVLLFANLIGMGLGPLAIGALSDLIRPWLGQESLRYALLATSPGYLWGAWHLWRASHTVTHDLDALGVQSARSRSDGPRMTLSNEMAP